MQHLLPRHPPFSEQAQVPSTKYQVPSTNSAVQHYLPSHPPLGDQAQVLLLVLLSHLYKSLSVLDKDKEKVNFERFRIKNKEKKIEVENA